MIDGTQTVLDSHGRLSPLAGGLKIYALRKIALLVVLCVMSLGFTLGLSSCSTNPATGEEHLNLVSESQEIQMGQQADQEVIASMGLYPDSGLQRWIQQFGASLAKTSERPNLPWTFRVVDDPVVNAFALPGGYIYVTRGLMAHVENEAELAGVVGHEIGHVTAQHSVHRMSTQQLTQLGVAAGMILKPELQKYGQVIGTGLGLLFLKFSRDDEKQADDLGLRYMTRADYDAREMPKVFQMLASVSQSEGGGRIPEWMSTHPDPGNREARMNKALDSMGATATRGGQVDQEQYLRLIDGMTFGENPREGFFQNGVFYQPELKFQFQFPQGWRTVNQKQAVIGVSGNQDAVIQISAGQGSSSEEAANKFFGQQGLQSGQPRTGNLNGLPAVSGEFQANTEQGLLHGVATFIEHGNGVYQVIGYTTEQLWPRYSGTFGTSMQSFSRLTDPKLLNVEPMRLKIVRVSNAATLGQLARQYDSPAPIEKLALINQVDTQAKFSTGERVKMIVGNKDDAGVLAR